jgi:hypothetical protein
MSLAEKEASSSWKRRLLLSVCPDLPDEEASSQKPAI